MDHPPPPPEQGVYVVGAAIVAGSRCLVVQRGEAMSSPLKWEFPGGKVEPGELPRQALEREIQEELGMAISAGDWLGRGTAHSAAGRLIVLDVFLAHPLHRRLELREHRQWGWFQASALPDLDWAAADVPVLPAVQRLLRRLADATARDAPGTSSPGAGTRSR